MKRNMKKIISFILAAFICLHGVCTTQASNFSLTEGGTYTVLVDEYMKSMSPANPYVSPRFIPESEEIRFLLVADGRLATKYTFTYYIQVRDDDGTWSNVYIDSIRGGSGTSTGYDVVPGEVYRVRVTTNDNKSGNDFVNLTIYEYR